MRTIALGPSCNNACIFCAQGDVRDPESASAIDVEAQLSKVQVGDVVAFQGGEPTLHEDLPAWIRAADGHGASRIVVQTNGRRLAYEAYVRALRAASSRVSLEVSLHGSNAAMHDYHTGTAGSFEQTITGLRRARVERIPAALTAVVTRSNFRHLSELVRIAHVSGAKAVHFALAQAAGRAYGARARIVPARDMVSPYLAKALAEAQMLKLATLVTDGAVRRASPPDAEQWFVGIGSIGPSEVVQPGEGGRRVALTVLAAGGGNRKTTVEATG